MNHKNKEINRQVTKTELVRHLLKAKLPGLEVSNIPKLDKDGTIDLRFKFEFRKERIANAASAANPNGKHDAILLYSYIENRETERDSVEISRSTLKHYYKGNMSLDELCQSAEVVSAQGNLATNLINNSVYVDRSKVDLQFMNANLKKEPYLAQSMVYNGKDLSLELLDVIGESPDKKIPAEYKIAMPANIIPDKKVIRSVLGYIAEGMPSIALLGPTGSGKSLTARYVSSVLHNYGYAAMVIDANERTEGDRLFDRDDFDQEGTFVLEGTILEFARKTRERGLKGIVILEEYNAFNDGTRREFYRLFSNSDRYYQVESSHNQKVVHNYEKRNRNSVNSTNNNNNNVLNNRVPFDHIQFLITANPITSDRYLVDDLKRLSNAETRRVTIVYHDYVSKRREITNILKCILRAKPILKPLTERYPDFPKMLSFDKGAECFQELNTSDNSGNRLGYDFGYTSIANWIWTAAIRGNTANAWITSSLDHLLNPVPDHEIRKDVSDKLEAKFGIKITRELILRDS